MTGVPILKWRGHGRKESVLPSFRVLQESARVRMGFRFRPQPTCIEPLSMRSSDRETPADAPPDTPSDAELLAWCRAGQARGWRLLVQRYQRLVYAVARRAGHDEHAAADVFQTVFTRLMQALPSLQQPDRLRAWIVTTAKREALLQWRRGQRTVSLSPADDADPEGAGLSDPADEAPLPEQLLDELQQMHLLRLAMEQLDARCHGLLTLLFADAEDLLPYEQIAIRLDMPTGSIGPTRARCLGKLRTLLARIESR
jgi:RNA polymerase sigma factor (sigma-70 family)